MLRASLVVVFLAVPAVARAQHDHHDMAGMEDMPGRADAQPPPGAADLPMARAGSGTAWLPDSSPMRAIHRMVGGWALMFHGNAFLGYDAQSSAAGDDEVVSQNWIMAMASHAL